MSLLEKVRNLNSFVQNSKAIKFPDIAAVLSELLKATIYIVDVDGTLRGRAYAEEFKCEERKEKNFISKHFRKDFLEYLNGITSAEINIEISIEECFIENYGKCLYKARKSSVFPIYAYGDRAGTLICSRRTRRFNDEDTVVGECGVAIAAFEFMHCRRNEDAAKDARREAVDMAFEILSFSEKKAIKSIFMELNEMEGMLVASKIADRSSLTRSVIVNALRKFETAGIIETQSLGMKGTYIKVKNEFLYEGLAAR